MALCLRWTVFSAGMSDGRLAFPGSDVSHMTTQSQRKLTASYGYIDLNDCPERCHNLRHRCMGVYAVIIPAEVVNPDYRSSCRANDVVSLATSS